MSNRNETLISRGEAHFKKATEMALTTKGLDVANALLGVAENMVEAGIAPTVILEELMRIERDMPAFYRGINNDQVGDRAFLRFSMSKVYAMLGRYSEMRALIPSSWEGHVVRGYVYAAEACVRNGNSPGHLLEEATDRVARYQTYYDDYFPKIDNYAQIAKAFQKAGLNPEAALLRAEEILERKEKEEGGRTWDRVYETLGRAYAACGLPIKSLGMVDCLVEIAGNKIHPKVYARNPVESIMQSLLRHGHYEEAVLAARKLDLDLFVAETLAYKAANEAERKLDPSAAIEEALSLFTKRTVFENVYEKVYPQLGLALALCGNDEEARKIFRRIRRAINAMDVLYKADVGFALAEARDKAGYKHLPYYKQAFAWSADFRVESPDWERFCGMSWIMHRQGVETLIKRQYLALAETYIAQYPDDGWGKSRLLALLAAEEVRSGLA